MAMPEIDEVKDAALKYDKKALAKMVQMGQMSNTTAMMAAMMRDRIVQSEMKPPAPPTVADEVFQPAQGLAAVPTDPRMFQGMAGGGIVAMADGGTPPSTTFMGALGRERQVDKERLRAYYLANGLPLPEELKTPEERGVRPERGPAGSMYELAVQPVVDFFTTRSGSMNEPSMLSQFLQRKKAEAMGGAPSRENPQGSTYRSDIAPPVAEPTFGPDIAKAEAAMAAQAAAIQSGVGAANRADPKFLAAGQEKAVAYAPTSVAAPKPQAKPPEKGLGATKEAQDFAALRSAQADVEKTLKDQMGDKPTAQGVLDDLRVFDKEFGVDRDFFKKQAAALEAQREEIKGDRKEAANMRLLEAGLSILGGTSPYAFENIGKGASKALAGFADDIKDIKRQTRELEKARQDVLRAEQVAARSDSAKAQDTLEKRSDKYKGMQLELAKTRADFATKYEELGLRKEALKVQREQANKPSDTMTLFNIATAGMTPEQKQATAGAALGRGAARTDFTKGELLSSWSSIEKDPAALDRYNQMGITGFSQYEQYMRTGMKPIDTEALRYARENPNDPRSAQILQRLGVK